MIGRIHARLHRGAGLAAPVAENAANHSARSELVRDSVPFRRGEVRDFRPVGVTPGGHTAPFRFPVVPAAAVVPPAVVVPPVGVVVPPPRVPATAVVPPACDVPPAGVPAAGVPPVPGRVSEDPQPAAKAARANMPKIMRYRCTFIAVFSMSELLSLARACGGIRQAIAPHPIESKVINPVVNPARVPSQTHYRHR